MTSPTRRQLLHGAGTTALTASFTGCLGFGFGNSGGPWYDLSLEPLKQTLHASIVSTDADHSSKQQAVIRDAVTATNNTATTYGWEPFKNNTYVEHNGTYYQTEITSYDDTKPRERYVVYTKPVAKETATNAASIDAFPERDRRPLMHALKYGHSLDKKTTTAETVPNRYVYVLHEATAENSALVPSPDPRYLLHNEEYFEIVVERRTIEEDRVEVSVSEVAESPEAFDAYAKRTVLDGSLSRDSLSSEAMEIVETAVNDKYGYDEEVPLSEPYVAVLKACGYDATSETVSGESIWEDRHYVWYQNRYYRAQLRESVA